LLGNAKDPLSIRFNMVILYMSSRNRNGMGNSSKRFSRKGDGKCQEMVFWELEKDVVGNTFMETRNMKKIEMVNCK
jgi:hypothetical protein